MLRFNLRPLAATLAIAMALAFGAATYAEARGGRGFGIGSRGTRTFQAPPPTRTAPGVTRPVERSVTQPAAPQRANTAPAPARGAVNRPGLFGGGVLGGLAAGFLGAGLLGLLFGHGLFGGLTGFASVLGFLLQIGLLAFVGVLLFRMWQGRRQPALAGGPPLRDTDLNRDAPGPLPMSAGAASTTGLDFVDITPADFDAFERLLGEIQAAYSAEDLNALRMRVTPEVLSYFAEELADNASRGVTNEVRDVKLEQGDLAESWREGDTDYATVAMRYSLVDRLLDRATGRVVDPGNGREDVTEVWTFRRVRNGPWMLSAIQQVA